MSTPRTDLAKNRISASVLSGPLTQCHKVEFDWKLLPSTLEVCYLYCIEILYSSLKITN